ncbi:MAG: hypothetical protein N3G21_08115, partial [Candidatus Hydrogenedentes bacterium]|nr:hypothetical protein [Candidatus Hydrogenedentota bacterium]
MDKRNGIKGVQILLLANTILIFGLNFVTVLIPVSVLGLELYMNTQRLKYIGQINRLKRDVLPYIELENLPIKVSPEKEESLKRGKVGVNYFEKIISDMKGSVSKLYFRVVKGKAELNEKTKGKTKEKRKEECSYETLRAMVDKLRAEKRMLENLHYATKYSLEFDLEPPKPEHIITVSYYSDEKIHKQKLAGESDKFKPKREKVIEKRTNPTRDWDYFAVVLFLIEKYKDVKNWLLYPPVEAGPQVVKEDLVEGNKSE